MPSEPRRNGNDSASDGSVRQPVWVALAILFLIYVSNTADRQVLSILAPQIKRDLGLSDAAVGILIGPAIAFLYGVLGVPLAYAADRIHRVRLVALCLAAWSCCTALGGLAGNAWQLAGTRIGVSAAEAGGIPASTSILGDLFPPAKRGLALSIYSTGSTFGIFISFSIGGLIAHSFGWRAALICAGAPGLILCLLILLLVREPIRGSLDRRLEGPLMHPSLATTIRTILSIKPYRLTLAGAAILNLAIATTLSWGPSYAIRKFALDSATAGTGMGLGIAVAGGLFILLGGLLTNRLGPNALKRSLWIVAFAQLASLLLFVLFLLAPNFPIALLAMGFLYGTMHLYVGPYYVVAHNVVPYPVRASTVAVGVLVMTILGQGLAPLLTGVLSDLLRPHFGALSLNLALTPAIPAIIISFWLFRRAAQSIAAVCDTEIAPGHAACAPAMRSW